MYVAAALFGNGRWEGTNAVCVDDRAEPQTIRIGDGVILARYLDRRPEESMAETPSIGKTLRLKIVSGCLEAIQS